MSHAFGPLLDALRGLRWPSTARVTARSSGAHASTQRGPVGEFAEYRLYRQGDDPRTLDWKLLARSDRPFVRLADDRAPFPTCVLLDASASMAFPVSGGPTPSKWDVACALAVGLLFVARTTGDPIGAAVAHPQRPLRAAPRSRRGALEEIIRQLDSVTPIGAAPLAPSLTELPRHARLVILTDALGDHDALVAAVRGRGQIEGRITLLHLVASEELELPAGVHRVDDPEVPADPRQITASTRPAYADAFGTFRREVAATWRGLGAAYRLVSTDTDPVRAVRALVTEVSVGAARPSP